MRIECIQGDITTLQVDALVNAANMSLGGGNGVDGAIHNAAGPELLQECKTLHGCKTGHAKITKGYRLKAPYVIHAVGPVWFDGQSNEENDLKSCYQESLKIAEHYGLKSIAFPCISTGVYCFPREKAAHIVLDVVSKFKYENLEKIIFCCFDDKNYQIYQKLLNSTASVKIPSLVQQWFKKQ